MFEHCYFESHMPQTEADKDFKLLELLKANQGNAVVYCATPNAADYIYEFLSVHGMRALRLHKKMRAMNRQESLVQFNTGKNSVLVTCEPLTSEILPARVRLFVHFNYPVSIREYLRETSVAGLDGLATRCALLYFKKDKRTQKRDPADLREVVKYAQSAMCRTSWLAKFSGAEALTNCQRCDNCLRKPKSRAPEEKKRIDLDAILEASL